MYTLISGKLRLQSSFSEKSCKYKILLLKIRISIAQKFIFSYLAINFAKQKVAKCSRGRIREHIELPFHQYFIRRSIFL